MVATCPRAVNIAAGLETIMVPVEPFRLVEIHGYLKVGDEEWEGVGWWPEPTTPEGWHQLPADVATAFMLSARPMIGDASASFKFKCSGERTMAFVQQQISVSRYLNNHKPADPARVSWRPVVTVRIALGGGGDDGN